MNGSTLPAVARRKRARKSAPFSKDRNGFSSLTLGIQGSAPPTTSSILGCVAAVIAMVSPSQPRPAVIHRTSISEIGAGLRPRPGAVPIAPSFWASKAREARPASVHNKRVQLVARTHHDILAPIQLVSDGAVRYRSAEIGMPQRLAGGGIQCHQVVVWVAGKHQVS